MTRHGSSSFERPTLCPFCGGGHIIEHCKGSFTCAWWRCARCSSFGEVAPSGKRTAPRSVDARPKERR